LYVLKFSLNSLQFDANFAEHPIARTYISHTAVRVNGIKEKLSEKTVYMSKLIEEDS